MDTRERENKDQEWELEERERERERPLSELTGELLPQCTPVNLPSPPHTHTHSSYNGEQQDNMCVSSMNGSWAQL